jgi:hypothetical protein
VGWVAVAAAGGCCARPERGGRACLSGRLPLQWSSDELYEGRLTAHESVAGHTLADLDAPGGGSCCSSGSCGGRKAKKAGAGGGGAAAAAAAGSAAELPVLLLVDTAGCGCEEQKEEEGDSKANSGEAQVGGWEAGRLGGWEAGRLGGWACTECPVSPSGGCSSSEAVGQVCSGLLVAAWLACASGCAAECCSELGDWGLSVAPASPAPQVVMAHVQRLLAAGIPAAAIGVITPYNAQVGRGQQQLLLCSAGTCSWARHLAARHAAGQQPHAQASLAAPAPARGTHRRCLCTARRWRCCASCAAAAPSWRRWR